MPTSTNKKKVIINSTNVTPEILNLFKDRYPYGYEEDIIKYPNSQGQTVNAVPLETEDTYYLIKLGVEMDRKIFKVLEEDNPDDESDDKISEIPDSSVMDD